MGDGELEVDLVDRNLIVSRVVLKHASQERLREVEARDPEDNWRTLVYPVL